LLPCAVNDAACEISVLLAYQNDSPVAPHGDFRTSGEGNDVRTAVAPHGHLVRPDAGPAVRHIPHGRLASSADRLQNRGVVDLPAHPPYEGHTDEVWGVSVSPDGRRAVSASWDKTLRVWDLETGACLALYHAGSEAWSVAMAPAGERIVCGTRDGQVHFLKPVNFPPAGPVILTAVLVPPENSIRTATRRGGRSGRALCRCSACGTQFAPADEIISAIHALSGDMGPAQSPCLDLPAAAFDDPRLLSPCPHCNEPLKFNPFLVNG